MFCNSPIEITQHFIRTHMEQRSLEEALSCLTDTITWFGTGAFEIVHGKEDARRLLTEEINAFPAGYAIDFKDMTETMLTVDSGTVFGRVLLTDHAMRSQLDCRLTTACVQYKGHFLISSLHMSLPTELQDEGEYYPLTIATQKIQQIKDSFFNEILPGGFVCCDAAQGFKLHYVNDFFAKLLGYQSNADFLATSGGFFSNCFGVDEDVAGMERDVEAMEINGHRTFTYRVKTKSNGEIWLRGYTHKYEGDSVPNLLCFCMDISDIIQMEQELKAQKNQLEFTNAEIQTIISNIPGGVHRCRLFDTICVDYVSHGFEEMSGYTQEEIHTLFQDNYSLLLLEEDRDIFSDAICDLINKPADQRLEYRIRRKDGTVIRVADHFRSICMENGKMWGFGVAIDVTSQYEAQDRLQLLIDNIPGGLAIYEYSLEGIDTVYFSDGVFEMAGYSRAEYEQIAKANFAGIVFKEDIDILYQKIEQIIAGSEVIDCTYRVNTKRGDYRWITLRGTVADRRAGTIRVNAVLLDITETKELEEKLRIRDEEYSLAIQQSGKIVYRYTVADKSIYMLQKTADLFGFPSFAKNVPASIIDLNLIAPESKDDFIDFYEAILRGEKSGCATLHRKLKNGGFGWCQSHFTTLFNSIGEPVSAVISIEDITKQHEQELENEILRQNEELFQVVVSHSDRFIIKYDIRTRIAYVQPRTDGVFSRGEVFYNVPYGCVKEGIAEESAQAYINFYEKLMAGESTAKTVVKMRRNSQLDQWGWYRFDGNVIFDDKKQPAYAVVSFMEVTEEYEKELAYERMNKHVNRLSTDAMLYFEANLTEMKIKRAGGHWLCNIENRLDTEPAELLDTCIDEMVYPEDRSAIKRFFERNSLLTSFAEGKTEKEAEYRIVQNNQSKWISVTIEMIEDPYTENVLVYVLFRDIDKIKTKEMNMLKLAETDGLTHLYNRTTTERKIKQLLENRHGEVCALVIIDVDNLKQVNDTLGHIQGDCAIKAFADTLFRRFGEGDVVGRIGGDEFLVFLQDVESEKRLNNIMRELVCKLSTLRVGEHDEYHLHASIGVIVSNSGGDDFVTLYKKADIALYYVKRHGKNNYAIYSDDMKGEDI